MSVLSQIESLAAQASAELESASSTAELELVKVRYLGRKGELSAILKGVKDLAPDERKPVGAAANKARSALEGQIKDKLETFSASPSADFDYTLPGVPVSVGRPHLLVRTMSDIAEIFSSKGFLVANGPEIESDRYNFGALNFPPDHPARDMQDTFYLSESNGLPAGLLLRTHTSNVQIRQFESRTPPVKIIAPGKVFRHEAVSSRAYCVFHQVEGFQVGVDVTLGDLKGVLLTFCQEYFAEDIQLRFRPSFFPFTEPSAEVDMSCLLCDGKGCSICKYDGWLEILGCGMIDPNVMSAVGYDPEELTGYAFGMGVERIAMLKHRITDIRLFYENDLRFLRQF